MMQALFCSTVSGGSRPETGYDGSDQMSGIGSVAESLLRLVGRMLQFFPENTVLSKYK